MSAIRRYLPSWIVLWLTCQFASVSAFVPADCCTAHRGTASARCQETAGARTCPMRGPDGEPCPMHRGDAEATGCVMQGTCNGPAVALASVFSNPGVLRDAPALQPDMTARAVAPAHSSLSPRSSFGLDPPPPRA